MRGLARPGMAAAAAGQRRRLVQGVTRDARFKELTAADVAYFRSDVFGAADAAGVLSSFGAEADAPALDKYNVDWLRTAEGRSQCVVRPRTTAQVSQLLRYCNDKRLPVCVQGGNTGLVGGSVPVFDEVILSLERMTAVHGIDAAAGTCDVDAGVVLESLDAQLQEEGLVFPLDLGSKGTCTIGGNLATNAGGLRLLRYGNLHGNVLGVEFVKANGEVVDVLSRNKKDNTGIDLKQLMIGSEGVLGVVTRCVVQCPGASRSKKVLLAGVPSYAACVDAFQAARGALGEVLSAFEFMDTEAMRVVRENLGLAFPSFLDGAGAPPFAVLIETSGSNEAHDEEKLLAFAEANAGLFGDRVGLATSVAQMREFWQYRERIAEAMLKDGYVFKYDVSLPDLAQLYELVTECQAQVAGDSNALRVVGYGHMGDGNLHLNVCCRAFDAGVLGKLEPWLWEAVRARKGSISAEHGIGAHKTTALHYSKADGAIGLMHELKALMDPHGILNPYKVLPPQASAA
eukprot:TRINITY_DN13730_c0_g1_i1.p3 TRINITY_DN13730_c0_g1~~TRINITY_DN13730_c0_g1_i1.p3  ORF type:complete len:514 (+),score=192.21 TRINITY_DN13730_c0_g1_i1:1938-3479(+)